MGVGNVHTHYLCVLTNPYTNYTVRYEQSSLRIQRTERTNEKMLDIHRNATVGCLLHIVGTEANTHDDSAKRVADLRTN